MDQIKVGRQSILFQLLVLLEKKLKVGLMRGGVIKNLGY
jgi:hypothetical protein